MRKQTATLMFLTLIVGLVTGGIINGWATEPVIEYVEVPVEKVVTKTIYVPDTHYITQEVPVVLTREVVKQVPVELQDWQTLEEVKEFLVDRDDELIVHLQAGRDGKYGLTGACSGWAIGLRELGAKYGKNIEVIRMTGNEYKKWFGNGVGSNGDHYLNMAIVGQSETWVIEPQNFEMRLPTYVP